MTQQHEAGESGAPASDRAMSMWDAIRSRRDVRAFDGRPIPAADLHQILEAGRRSPSSQNWQPWDFIAATDRQQLTARAPTPPQPPRGARRLGVTGEPATPAALPSRTDD
jgi:Nitroreductase family